MEKKISSTVFRLVKGDITQRNVAAIVNAANSYLTHGGGVARAILQKGGQKIQEESNKIGYVPVGFAALTTAGKLPCNAVIHTVGPRMGEGDEDNKLKNAIISCLELATQNNFKSISIPAISSGVFGFPKNKCAKILVSESKKFIEENESVLEVVEFCIFDDETFLYFQKEFEKL